MRTGYAGKHFMNGKPSPPDWGFFHRSFVDGSLTVGFHGLFTMMAGRGVERS
jgi:hypothetical protein